MSAFPVISEAVSLALHAAAILAIRPDERHTTRGLADSLGASSNHLAKVMRRLTRARIIAAVAGPKGGFRLERSAREIRLLEIYEAVAGRLEVGECLLNKRICDGEDCFVGCFVRSVQQQVRDLLTETTLTDLANGAAIRRSLVPLDSDADGQGGCDHESRSCDLGTR